jgi:hypothetical protein
MIQSNGSLLNMGSTWQTSATGLGLDVTGNNASAFVLTNLADHDMFFAKNPVSDTNNLVSTFWIVPKGRKVLFWQNGPFFTVMPKRVWSAFLLPNVSEDFAAHLAETMMYDVLGQENPV